MDTELALLVTQSLSWFDVDPWKYVLHPLNPGSTVVALCTTSFNNEHLLNLST